MQRFGRVISGSFLLAGGVVLALGDAFLISWERSSAGHPDIAARGIWILAAYLPYFVVAGWLVAAGLAAVRARQHGIAPLVAASLALVATVLAVVAIYVEPTRAVFRLVRVLSTSFGGAGPFLLYGAAIALGVWLLWTVAPRLVSRQSPV